ncbi:MAG: ATP-binding protein [Cytophagales bacterium]|nr:ATP-binding protein [Cytophagales bacterium]
MRKRFVVSGLFFLGIVTGCYAQQPDIDSLRGLLQQFPRQDTTYAIRQIELAYRFDFIDPDKAIALADSALAINRRYKYAKGIGRAYHVLGQMLARKGRDAEAMDAYQNAFVHFEKAGDKRGLAATYAGMGQLHERQRLIPQALDNYQKAYRLASETRFTPEAARSLARIAAIYNQHQLRSDTALFLLKQAMRENKTPHDAGLESVIQHNIGYAYLSRQEYATAKQYFEKALQIAVSEKLSEPIAAAHKALAITALRTKNYAEGRRHGQLALESSHFARDIDGVRGASFLLSNVYEHLGNHKEALRYQRMGEQAKDSLYNIEKTRLLSNQQWAFEVKSRQREIDLLNQNRLLQARELQQRTWQRNLSVIGGGLLAALAFLLYRNMRRQHRVNQLLEEKNDEIERQRGQLIELNATKDKLFSIVSHDIRSPLGSMEALLQLLEDGTLSADELTAVVPDLRRKVRTTSELLSNILQWSRSQMGGITTQTEILSLQAVVNEIITAFQTPAEEKGIALECQVPTSLQVVADRNMTSLVLRNLVSNAIKFTPEGGRVTVRAENRTDGVLLAVADTGKGMTSEQQSRLFDVRTHFSTNGTANEAGTGLGLLLCKEFVEKNNGSIWVESQPGQGSRFFVRLPSAA